MGMVLSFRLTDEEQKRFEPIWQKFLAKNKFAKRTNFVRCWIGLDSSEDISAEDRAYLLGKRGTVPEDDDGTRSMPKRKIRVSG